ncbi:HPr family phosphocarrier protein [Cohnella candidum]|uniref:HPr family phosphocarrier protein n=1 Tax=Cohnella candidum TaxID=2674991 RepID=A0A3G3JZ77_9BACL|nr:HPr family phosphocarrier protein [Cohnella candidum]AYQ73493.1 HPr family phosphocarrier protein [Cohnella candidum]
MISQTFKITNPSGFHVRPTKTFVQAANQYPCKITVINKGKKVNGKSSLSMLTLGIAAQEEVTLEIEGEREDEAMQELGKLFTEVHE